MSAPDSFVAGDVFYSSSQEDLARILESAGIEVVLGPWALRLFGSPHRFELGYVGNIDRSAPFKVQVDGYGIPWETIKGWCDRLADCLRASGIGFDYVHFDARHEPIRAYTSGPARRG